MTVRNMVSIVLPRQFRALPSAAVMLVVAVALTSAVVSVVPRVLVRVADDDLRQAIENADPEQRNIRLDQRGRLGTGPQGDRFTTVANTGSTLLADEFPDSVQAVIDGSQFVVDTPQFRIASFPDEIEGPFPTSFSMRYIEGIENEVTLIRGRLPAEREPLLMLRGHDCPDNPLAIDGFVPDPEVRCDLEELPVFEVTLSIPSAHAMELDVGDRVMLAPEQNDNLWRTAHTIDLNRRSVLVVSGIVGFSDSAGDFWYGDTGLHRPRITENADYRLIYAQGLMFAEDYPRALRSVGQVDFDYSWRYKVDPAAIDSQSVNRLAVDLARIGPRQAVVRTQLLTIIDDFLIQRAQTTSLMSTTIAGVVAAFLGAIVMLALLMVDRIQAAIVLVRRRGASSYQTSLVELIRAVLLVVPAATFGWLFSTVVEPSQGRVGLAQSGLAALAAIFVLLVASVPLAVRALAGSRNPAERRLHRIRKALAETVVVAAGVAAIVLLRRRGGLDQTMDQSDFDGLLAVAPVVLAIAGGLIVLRLMTPLVAFLSWAGSRRRGLAWFIGFRRVVTQPGAARVALVVVMLAASTAVFGSVVKSSIVAGQTRHAWQVSGADMRAEMFYDGMPLPAELDLAQVRAQSTMALGAEFPLAPIVGFPGTSRANLLALDVDAYAELLGSATTLERPVATLRQSLAASEDLEAIPAVVSSAFGPADVIVGTKFTVIIGGLQVKAVVVAVAERFPALSSATPFVVLDRTAMDAIEPGIPIKPTVLYMNGSRAQLQELVQDLTQEAPLLRVTSRQTELAKLANDPLSRWVDRGLLGAVVTGTLLAALGSVALVALTSERRRYHFGILRTLGLRRSEATVLSMIELLPLVVFSTVGGVGVGVGVVRALEPALDLQTFSGPSAPTPLVVDVSTLVGVVLVLVVSMAISVAVALARQRNERDAELVRMGGDA